MDLKNLLSGDSGPTVSSQPKPAPPAQPMPSTPVQAVPPQSFRDYSHTTQASPIRQLSQEYPSQPMSGAYGSPPPYQGGVPYASRAPPPPLQPLPPNDLRSPSIASGPAPSPYRQTPTSSISAAGSAYPFPPAPQHPQSPVQLHQYPPRDAYHRDSFSHASPVAGLAGPPSAGPYAQAAPMPQTPPIGTPGGAHPFLHQRSQSIQSTSTPTSAQSQPQYGAPYLHGSPVATNHPPPQLDPHARQSSQPPTPLGPPISATRQSSLTSFAQPPSPYQQRLSSVGPYHHGPSQNSPPPPPPPAIPARMPSNHSIYEQQPIDPTRRSHSQSEREKSVSVSPKTRVPSLQSSVGHPSDSEPRLLMPQPAVAPSMPEPKRERAVTPAKRKLEDRDLRPEELEKKDVRPAPFDGVNGGHTSSAHLPVHQPAPPARAPSLSASPVAPKRKHARPYPNVPPWAQVHEGQALQKPNFVIHKPKNEYLSHMNGQHNGQRSRHASPEDKRVVTEEKRAPRPPEPPQKMDGLLGPWEPSFTGMKPFEEMSKNVADFIFVHTIFNPNATIIEKEGIPFEIEAKLGEIISKDTNERISLPVETECVITDSNRIAFRSTMTVEDHAEFNNFLNELVKTAHPRFQAMTNSPRPRVEVHYAHTFDLDTFFPLDDQARTQLLPAFVQSMVRYNCKARVTYDKHTKQEKARIVKVNVANLHLHFPMSPLDCRISVNLEVPLDVPTTVLQEIAQRSNRDPAPNRDKNRMSYTQGHYRIDLTQVKQTIEGAQLGPRDELEHELEIEVAQEAVLEHGRRAQNNLPHQYPELIEGLVDNIRMLARKAKDHLRQRQGGQVKQE